MQYREAFDTAKDGKSSDGTLAIKVVSEYTFDLMYLADNIVEGPVPS